MKLELEGPLEVERHVTAVRLLLSLGYVFGKTGWKPRENEGENIHAGVSRINNTLAISDADGKLQADIEHLCQRADEIEKTLTHSFGAWARDSTVMPEFEKTVNRGIDQALLRAVSPGGVIYGRLK